MPRKFHGLKKPKVRQDWSKYNLYNLSRMTLPPASNKTFFQQKWLAKSITRAYHNPHVREGTWTRMFDRRLPAVVPMDYHYLAKHDGSELAAGRGSGLDVLPQNERAAGRAREGRGGRQLGPQKTPYMHMVYHPMERRLDTAIWRAMFASSTKQARQFVVHGYVKVNGHKMIYPGYQLNPGDMFSVDPDRVMYATGARKYSKNSPHTRQQNLEDPTRSRRARQTTRDEDEDDPEAEDEVDGETGNAADTEAQEAGAVMSRSGAATLEETIEDDVGDEQLETPQRDAKREYKRLMRTARKVLESKEELSAKRLQELRSFVKAIKRPLSAAAKLDEAENKDELSVMETMLAGIVKKIPESALPSELKNAPSSAADKATPSNKQMADGREDQYMVRKNAELLQAALRRARENPQDVSKSYATPWKPREFMSVFAFIPRYLEVNQNICSAVYLRHPVARPGLAEVPSPFHQETAALAFNWYLRRR